MEMNDENDVVIDVEEMQNDWKNYWIYSGCVQKPEYFLLNLECVQISRIQLVLSKNRQSATQYYWKHTNIHLRTRVRTHAQMPLQMD